MILEWLLLGIQDYLVQFFREIKDLLYPLMPRIGVNHYLRCFQQQIGSLYQVSVCLPTD
jgi:hypothetical protein